MTTNSHFARAAERFDQSSISQQLAGLAQQLIPLLDLAPHQHWLDFGAGTGVLSIPLARKVSQVTALDTSAAMLERLAEKNIANIQLLQQDIFTGLPHRYNGVVSSMALHHVQDTAQLFHCLHAHIMPGAQLAFIDLYSEDGSFHGDNEGKGVKHLGFNPEHLQQQAAAAGFSALKHQEIFSIQHKNSRRYPLFLLLARA